MSILAVGSVAFDTIKTPLGKVTNVLGGSGSYFSVSASNFTSVQLVAVVGEDFPQKHVSFFKKRNIDVRGLEIVRGKTFSWEGEYGWDFADPQTHATNLNVFAQFRPKIPILYRKAPYVFLANIDPQLQLNVLKQVQKPKLIACDTMNYWIQHKPKALRKLLKYVDVFLLNASEAKQLTAQSNIIAAGKALIRMGPQVVVIKKGEHGVLLFSKNASFAAPAYLLESIVDPTGAGDTFAGGFIGHLTRCKKMNQAALREAVIYGSIMATFAVEDFSLRRLGTVKKADIIKRFRHYKRLTRY